MVALVGSREGDDQVAIPIGARSVGIEAVRVNLQSAAAAGQGRHLRERSEGLSIDRGGDNGERFARAIRDVVYVSPVGDVEKTSDDLGGILIDRTVAVGNHEGIVHRGDGDREGRGGAMVPLISRRVVDCERSVPVSRLGEDVGSVAVEAEDALTRQGRVGIEREVRRAHRGRRDGQRLGGATDHVIDVGAVGIGQDRARGASRFVFDDRHATRLGGEVIVHRGDRERERRGRRAAVIVGHMVSDQRDGAVPVAGRREGIGTIAAHDQGAARQRDGTRRTNDVVDAIGTAVHFELGEAERLLGAVIAGGRIDIGVTGLGVGQDIAGDRFVGADAAFGNRSRVRSDDDGVVDLGDGDVD